MQTESIAKPSPVKTPRPPPKPLFNAIYESFFSGSDPSVNNSNFWDDLFLLKVNTAFLERNVEQKTEHELIALAKLFNNLFHRCVHALADENPIRVGNALKTMRTLLLGIFRKKYSNFTFDVLTIICGVDEAEAFFRKFIQHLQEILLHDNIEVKTLGVELLLTIATATDNVNQNSLLEYFMRNDIFDSLLRVITTAEPELATSALVVLALLVQFQKYEILNPYGKRLQTLKSDVTLQKIANVLANAIQSIIPTFKAHVEAYMKATSAPTGLVGYITSWFSFAPKEPPASSGSPPIAGALLLFLYELVYENKQFSTSCFYQLESTSSQNAESEEQSLYVNRSIDNLFTETPPKRLNVQLPPLAMEFLKLCALLFNDVKDFRNQLYSKLALIILILYSENNDMCSLLHDAKLAVAWEFPSEVASPNGRPTNTPRPLAALILDLLIIFLRRNLKNDFSPDLCIKSLEALHRLLCYQKKFRVRLPFKWTNLWCSLLRLIKFISNRELFLQKNDMIVVADKIVNVFNMFINYGDQFMPSLADYDELYYELLCSEKELRTFLEVVKDFDTTRQYSKDFENITTILDHFSHRIEAWYASNPAASLDSQGVIKVIKDNYETLKLKLLATLERYESFSEHPKESLYFRQLVRAVVVELKSGFAPPDGTHPLNATTK